MVDRLYAYFLELAPSHFTLSQSSTSHVLLRIIFLVACTRLYTPLCPSVCWSVGPSHFYFFFNFISLSHLKSFKSIASHRKSF